MIKKLLNMLSQSLRKKSFLLLDHLKGGKVKSHYEDVLLINKSKDLKKVNERRQEIIKDFLVHATETTPFYKQFKGVSKIEDFPVIKKITVKDNFDDFKSETYLEQPNFKVSTSGSTGLPFVLYQNKEKRIRNTADNLFFLNTANFDIGERLYFLEAWRGVSMNKPILSKIKNLVYVDISRFNDDAIEDFLQKLEQDPSPKSIMGLPSAFESICKYLDNNEGRKLSFKGVNSVIAVSEYLNGYVKSTMEKHFKTPVFSRYSNEEMGIMAQQLPSLSDGNVFKINWASYHVEILKMDSDEKASEGEMGRLVVTDLFNYCMPLIRYDTGDVSSFSHLPTKDKPYPDLARIEGRRMDFVYDTKGEVISPHLVYTLFYQYYHLLNQYQFVQFNEKEYVVRLNVVNAIFEYEEALINAIKNEFGLDAMVTVEYVDEIPSLSSGKRKKVLNMCLN